MVRSLYRRGRGWASSWIAKSSASTASYTSVWAIIRTIRIRRGPAGRRLFRTTVGPIRKTTVAWRSPISMASLFDLNGRVAVVVGATSGLGRAIAIGLAQHGADVVPSGRRKELVAGAC